MPIRPLVLASASPARLALLQGAGFAPRVLVSGVAEDGVHGLSAADTARTLAERKAAAVAERLARPLAPTGAAGAAPSTITGDRSTAAAGDGGAARSHVGDPPTPVDTGDPPPLVLGCDSVLSFEGEVRGKPTSVEEATAWCRGYRGRRGTLVTGHAVVDAASGRRVARTSETVVRFGRPTDAEIDAYVATGEPLAVAGGFTLDGYCAPFVEGVDGDHGTVLGLSLPVLRELLAELDVAITDLWAVPR